MRLMARKWQTASSQSNKLSDKVSNHRRSPVSKRWPRSSTRPLIPPATISTINFPVKQTARALTSPAKAKRRARVRIIPSQHPIAKCLAVPAARDPAPVRSSRKVRTLQFRRPKGIIPCRPPMQLCFLTPRPNNATVSCSKSWLFGEPLSVSLFYSAFRFCGLANWLVKINWFEK